MIFLLEKCWQTRCYFIYSFLMHSYLFIEIQINPTILKYISLKKYDDVSYELVGSHISRIM